MIDTICIYYIYPHVKVRTLEAECNCVTHNTSFPHVMLKEENLIYFWLIFA